MIISHDRLRHWTILKATAPLPRRSRIAARRALLERLQRAMLRRADMLLIRHPKTGGTWLRTLLTHLYATRDGISQRRVFKSDELQRQKPDLPRFLITNGWSSWERIIAEAFSAGDPVLDGKKTLFLARHPGDIAVSWHRQYQKRTKAFKRELLEADMDAPPDFRSLDRWSFIQRPELGLPALIDYHNFWTATLSGRDDALILRYEDLHCDTERELLRIVEFLGERFTPEQIRAAVRFGSAENMRDLERSGYFQNASLRLRDANDADTLKVRRAEVGGYREDLEPEQAAWVDEALRTQLDPRLGYGTRIGPDAKTSSASDAKA